MKKPIIISCERSGLNMFRLMTELFTGHRTPGNKEYGIGDKELAFVRTHDYIVATKPFRKPSVVISSHKTETKKRKYEIAPSGYKVNKMILLLRHPVRHWVEKGETGMIQYANNLKAYEKFKGEKLVIYYENLIKSKRPYYEAWKLLGLSHKPIEDFFKSLEEAGTYYKKIKKKKKIQGRTYSDEEKQNALKTLERKIGKGERKHINKYLKNDR